jgi:hypothetical protein
MRYIALILAPAMVLAALSAAGATEAVAPSSVKIAVFPFELEDFSAGAAYVPLMISTASNCGFRPRKPAG